jgi:hypothetical protein
MLKQKVYEVACYFKEKKGKKSINAPLKFYRRFRRTGEDKKEGANVQNMHQQYISITSNVSQINHVIFHASLNYFSLSDVQNNIIYK